MDSDARRPAAEGWAAAGSCRLLQRQLWRLLDASYPMDGYLTLEVLGRPHWTAAAERVRRAEKPLARFHSLRLSVCRVIKGSLPRAYAAAWQARAMWNCISLRLTDRRSPPVPTPRLIASHLPSDKGSEWEAFGNSKTTLAEERRCRGVCPGAHVPWRSFVPRQLQSPMLVTCPDHESNRTPSVGVCWSMVG